MFFKTQLLFADYVFQRTELQLRIVGLALLYRQKSRTKNLFSKAVAVQKTQAIPRDLLEAFVLVILPTQAKWASL